MAELSIRDLALESPHRFETLAALRLAVLLAVRSGGLHHLRIDTARDPAATLHDVAAMELDGDRRLELADGLHSSPGGLELRDGAPGLGPSERHLVDELDRRVHLHRFGLWLALAYPALADELKMACPDETALGELQPYLVESAMQPLRDAILLRTGLPSRSQLAGEIDWPGLAWAILLGSGAAIEELLGEELGAPVLVLPGGERGCLRLSIGPLTWEAYCALLPIGSRAGLRALLQLVRLLAGPQVAVEVTLILDSRELPGSPAPGSVGYPGWTLFVRRAGEAPGKNPQVVISATRCQAALRMREEED